MAHLYDSLAQEFTRAFSGLQPRYIIRVPGRVNLIGEHTDYNGLPVMPMAISREVRIAIAPRTDKLVQLKNTQQQFLPREFAMTPDIPAYDTGDWGNYVKAGVQGALELLSAHGVSIDAMSGFTALVDSDLPMAAGLSSSSAMVVASALAFLANNGAEVIEDGASPKSADRAIAVLSRSELAEHMAQAERYVGTMGGGMDQAAVLLARAGAALKIDFFPLKTGPVTLPDGYSIIICNSMVVAPKTATARLHYNRRPLECRLATAILTKHLMGHTHVSTIQRVSELLPFFPASALLQEATRIFGNQEWNKALAASALDMDVHTLNDTYMRMRDGQILPEFPDGLPLLARMRHVLTEGERVRASVQALPNDAVAFGALMNASHASCRDDYGISCPELEELVSVAREAGAVGSRLTGAGFGGCTVNLVPTGCVEVFLDTVTGGYYQQYLKNQHPDLYALALERGLQNVIITSTPCQGAEILSI